MGCFHSSIFRSSREREGVNVNVNHQHNRSAASQNQTTHSVDDLNALEPTFTYRPDSNDYILDHIYNDRSTKMGLELKRIHFNWTSKVKMNKTEIENKRNLFWETCDTFGGQKQIWEALKSICNDQKTDLEFANVILESCGVILPLGLLNEIYDSTGFRYNLPAYCVCDPIDLLYTECDGGCESTVGSLHANNIHPDRSNQTVKIRLSYGKDVIVSLSDHLKIVDLKNSIKQTEDLKEKQRMIMFWCGKVLDDNLSVESLNLPRGAVLQVMLP